MAYSTEGENFLKALKKGVHVNEETAQTTAQENSTDDYTLSRIAGRNGRGYAFFAL